jgi:hypothetical protein
MMCKFVIQILSNNGHRWLHLCAAIESDRLPLAVNFELLDKRENQIRGSVLIMWRWEVLGFHYCGFEPPLTIQWTVNTTKPPISRDEQQSSLIETDSSIESIAARTS